MATFRQMMMERMVGTGVTFLKSASGVPEDAAPSLFPEQAVPAGTQGHFLGLQVEDTHVVMDGFRIPVQAVGNVRIRVGDRVLGFRPAVIEALEVTP